MKTVHHPPVPRLLLVEDDPLISVTCAQIIHDAAWTSLRAASVEAAWAVLERRQIDVVLCDHELPDGRGLVLVERMMSAGIAVPVIYMSAGSPRFIDLIRALPLVTRVLAKPVTRGELINAIAGSLRLRSAGWETAMRADDRMRRCLDSTTLIDDFVGHCGA